MQDRWGVPHIYAGTLYDAFVAQAYTAARDRLWQMDTWRKRGLGQMAADFGPARVESDRAPRHLVAGQTCAYRFRRGSGRAAPPGIGVRSTFTVIATST